MRAYDVTESLQDLRHMRWNESPHTSGTSGMLLKASEGQGTGRMYYKLSCYDSYRGIFGHECVNEVIAARLMELLGVSHVRYQLIHALVTIDGREYETWLVRSRSYRHSTERKQAFDLYYRMYRTEGERPLDFCDRMGWGTSIRQMMAVDYLIANRDRHGANIEVLRGEDGQVRLAPLFDNGLSFVFSCYENEERVRRFNVLDDVPANNFIGTRSLEENLAFLKGFDLSLNKLDGTWREKLFVGLDHALPEAHREVIWEMIRKRWGNLEVLLDS